MGLLSSAFRPVGLCDRVSIARHGCQNRFLCWTTPGRLQLISWKTVWIMYRPTSTCCLGTFVDCGSSSHSWSSSGRHLGLGSRCAGSRWVWFLLALSMTWGLGDLHEAWGPFHWGCDSQDHRSSISSAFLLIIFFLSMMVLAVFFLISVLL